jgi:hypothetical protein
MNVTKYTDIFSVFDEDGEELAVFTDRFDAANFIKNLPWWNGDCRIKTTFGSKLPKQNPWWMVAA